MILQLRKPYSGRYTTNRMLAMYVSRNAGTPVASTDCTAKEAITHMTATQAMRASPVACGLSGGGMTCGCGGLVTA